MNEMLKTILDMDKQAQQKVVAAEEYRNSVISELSSKKNAVMEDETQRAKESALRRSERRKAQSEKYLSDIKERNGKVLAKMEKLYAENTEKWVAEIVENVTK